MIDLFIDRERELDWLQAEYDAPGARLVVLYGRRRIGKTQLLRQFSQHRPHAFFVATLMADPEQLAGFSQAIWRLEHGSAAPGFTFPSWEAAFDVVANVEGRPVIVMDEFTYLVSGNKALPSIIQKAWDARLRTSNAILVLCGSYIGMMEREVLSHGAALYGRRTASLLLKPLELPAAGKFFPSYSAEEQIAAWAVLGGMPYYLNAFDTDLDLHRNVLRTILSRDGLLFSEPELLLLEELREPRNYFSVLRAMAEGNTRLNEIAQSARIGDARTTARYLDLLGSMHLVSRQVPATERRPDKSRRGRYTINDPFLRFWFRFVQPNRSSLELGLAEAVLEHRVRPVFEQHVSTAFEMAARDFIAHRARDGGLAFLPERIGGWWSKDAEIDVLAVSDAERAMLLGECKWSTRPVGVGALRELQAKGPLVDPGGEWPSVSYALFSRGGFSRELVDVAKETGVLLVGPTDMVAYS